MLNLNKNHHRHPEFISGSNRHCERSEAISSRLPRATALAMTEQTGRSMVEMLGVLAVIGVLSITGISGYTTAMNKHRANEILDAASKRAVVVSTQLQSGRTNPTLAEFGNDNTVGGATFSTELETQGTDKFVIKFTSDGKPSSEIWAQMQNIAGKTGVVRGYVDERFGLVYNNDLTTDAKASDYNNDEDGCDETKYTWCSGSGLCLEGTNQTCTCSGTRTVACKKCNSATGAYDLADASLNNQQDKCSSGQVCNNGACEAAATCDKDHLSLCQKDECNALTGTIWCEGSCRLDDPCKACNEAGTTSEWYGYNYSKEYEQCDSNDSVKICLSGQCSCPSTHTLNAQTGKCDKNYLGASCSSITDCGGSAPYCEYHSEGKCLAESTHGVLCNTLGLDTTYCTDSTYKYCRSYDGSIKICDSNMRRTPCTDDSTCLGVGYCIILPGESTKMCSGPSLVNEQCSSILNCGGDAPYCNYDDNQCRAQSGSKVLCTTLGLDTTYCTNPSYPYCVQNGSGVKWCSDSMN